MKQKSCPSRLGMLWLYLLLVFLGHRAVHRPMAQVAFDIGAASTDAVGNDLAIDNSWDFSESDLIVGLPAASQGWGNANAMYQLDVVLTVRNGEFSGLIVGLKPNFASPLMQIHATPRHYLVMRMNYVGPNTDAEILIRSGALTSAAETFISAPQSQWEADQPVVGLSASNATDLLHTVSYSCDGDLHTYYLSNNLTNGVELVYDLGDFRWITQVHTIRLVTTHLTSYLNPYHAPTYLTPYDTLSYLTPYDTLSYLTPYHTLSYLTPYHTPSPPSPCIYSSSPLIIHPHHLLRVSTLLHCMDPSGSHPLILPPFSYTLTPYFSMYLFSFFTT